ncbi:MAG: LPXTG cell wall anchor domain-containing protein [Clostridiaceae bacterium]|nr:LPXTG cell wall anchor domain-containing protein [Clostridiaceae bacterium]
MKKSKRFLIITTLVLVLFTFTGIAVAWTAPPFPTTDPGYPLTYAISDRGVVPQYVNDNTPQYVTGYSVFKVNNNEEGSYLSGDNTTSGKLFTFYVNPLDNTEVLKVWLGIDGDGKSYIKKWQSANIAIKYFMVKGGDGFLLYTYSGDWTYDGHLYTPKKGQQQLNVTGISHITIAYTPDHEPSDSISTQTSQGTEPSDTQGTEPSDTQGTEPSDTQATEPSGSESTASQATESSQTVESSVGESTAAETTYIFTENTIPLVEPTTSVTTPSSSAGATTSTLSETTKIKDDEIPQTGETNQGVVIGAILVALGASLMLILRRRHINQD